jgi:hypothetical protein
MANYRTEIRHGDSCEAAGALQSFREVVGELGAELSQAREEGICWRVDACTVPETGGGLCM